MLARIGERVWRRDVSRLTLQSQPVKGAAQSVGQRAIGVEVNCRTQRSLLLRDNLDEKSGGNLSVKRRPVAS